MYDIRSYVLKNSQCKHINHTDLYIGVVNLYSVLKMWASYTVYNNTSHMLLVRNTN